MEECISVCGYVYDPEQGDPVGIDQVPALKTYQRTSPVSEPEQFQPK